MRIFESILNHLSSKKAYKTISWLILVIFILIIILYPIIDANFLYYKRVNNRIEILKEISSIDIASLGSNPVLAEEYNAIISEVSLAKEHYINNIFIIETGFWKNFVKVISASWIFIIFAIAMFFVRNDSEKKYNIGGGILCLIIGIIFGFIGYSIPTVINIIFNIAFYNIVVIYFGYTVVKNFYKKDQTNS